jgi:hypothetical protein
MPAFVMIVLVASLATLVVTQGVLPVAALAVALRMAAAVEEKMLALVVFAMKIVFFNWRIVMFVPINALTTATLAQSVMGIQKN